MDGKGGRSAFNDEPWFGESGPAIRHGEGVISMAQTGRDSSGSQFIMTAEKMSHLDGYHVAFGTVTKGLELVKAMGASYCVN